jgi:nucleoside-diphosphate-sugar epimerase
MSLDLASSRVLIFGINSFTGKYLSSYLSYKGYSIFGTTKDSCDITKKEDIEKILKEINPNYIINLSAIASPAFGDILEFYRVNSMGAINILEVLVELDLNPKKVILSSSATIYGNQGVEILDESLCPHPANYYGTSKLSMESIARNYFNRLNIIITRPFNYTGVGQSQDFLIPKIVNHFRERKETVSLGNLDVTREFNDIGFVCEVYNRLLESDTISEVVNICSGRGVKLLDVIYEMNSIAGYDIKVEINPKFVRKDEIKSLTGSPKKLFSLIGEVKQKRFKDTLKVMFEA